MDTYNQLKFHFVKLQYCLKFLPNSLDRHPQVSLYESDLESPALLHGYDLIGYIDESMGLLGPLASPPSKLGKTCSLHMPTSLWLKSEAFSLEARRIKSRRNWQKYAKGKIFSSSDHANEHGSMALKRLLHSRQHSNTTWNSCSFHGSINALSHGLFNFSTSVKLQSFLTTRV